MSTGPGHLVNTLISMKVPTFVSHTQSKVRWSHIKTSPTTRISNFCYACTCLISLGSGVSIAQCLAGYCFFPCCHTYTTYHFAGRTTSTNQKFQQKNYAFSKCPDIVCESVLHVCVSVCLCMRWLLSSEHRLPPTPPALSTVCSGPLARHASSPRSNVSSSYQRISMPAS